MARIFYWNIEKFSAPKILPTHAASVYLAHNRLNYILNVIRGPSLPPHTRPPDIIVIVEIFGGTQDVGSDGVVLPSHNNAAGGMRGLLNSIRHTVPGDWFAVPPIPTGWFGKREAVAVFYNANSLVFTGPYVYADGPGWNPLTQALPPTPANLNLLAPYDANWLNCLPANDINRRWQAPNGTFIFERQSAGDWQHLDPPNPGLLFTTPSDRRPFFVRFREINTNRTIKLFAIHTTPQIAVFATRRISLIPDVRTVNNDEVSVVVGDFNVDSFIGDPGFLPNQQLTNLHYPYEPLADTVANGGLGYEMLISPFPPGTVAQNANRKPYCMTHLLPIGVATPYNANGMFPDPQHNVYPRFGYCGSGGAGGHPPTDWGAIDNAFVKYGPNLAAVPHNTTIVNPVVGKPFDEDPAPPPGITADLTGGYLELYRIGPPIPQPQGINPGHNQHGFSDFQNYGLIRNVSDHLPIVFDV